MLTNNFYRIMASAVMTKDKQSITATNYMGQVKTSLYGYAYSGANQGFVIPNIMQTLKNSAVGSPNSPGVFLGDSADPPTMDDYTYKGNVITTFSSTAAVSNSADANGVSSIATYTITNTGSAEITIREICLFSRWYGNSTSDYNAYLLDRTVLDTPVTIPAGGIGQVTYTIRMNYPTV